MSRRRAVGTGTNRVDPSGAYEFLGRADDLLKECLEEGARQGFLANEVAEELSKVTWPSRKEVTNSTTVVVLTTVFATVFFALMDRFWSFITDKIYTF